MCDHCNITLHAMCAQSDNVKCLPYGAPTPVIIQNIQIIHMSIQHTQAFHPMLFQCWASVEDGGPTLKQQ